jgi:hypothetical protein
MPGPTTIRDPPGGADPHDADTHAATAPAVAVIVPGPISARRAPGTARAP